MLLIIQFFVYFIIIPIIYITILLFDFLLLTRTNTLLQRWQCLAGILAGLLSSAIIIIVDLIYGPLIPKYPQTNSLDAIWPLSVILSIIGFIIMLAIDLLLSRGARPFIILITITAVFTSSYFLLTLTEIRMSIAISIMGFLFGVIFYFMLFPSRIFNSLRWHDASTDEG